MNPFCGRSEDEEAGRGEVSRESKARNISQLAGF